MLTALSELQDFSRVTVVHSLVGGVLHMPHNTATVMASVIVYLPFIYHGCVVTLTV